MLMLQVALAMWTAIPLSAAPQAPPPKPPLFPRLFVRPTATNGMEQIVRAADLLSGVAGVDAAYAASATLTRKRALLKDPGAQQALRLLRDGLAKPVLTLDAPTELQMEALAALRGLGRLLAVEQYVLWAEGRTASALTSLENGLALGYHAQRQAVIGGLVGIAIDAMVLAQSRPRYAQWSADDCARVRRLAEAWLRAEDPAIVAIEMEQRNAARQLASLPNGREVSELLAARYRMLADALRRPAWERQAPDPVSGSSPTEEMAKALWATMRPALDRVMERWSVEMAQIQLLGVHGAIRGYLWEHARVPATLDELALGLLAIDPFTGKPLTYKGTGRDTYELYSVGPYGRDADGRPTAVRQPVGLAGSDARAP